MGFRLKRILSLVLLLVLSLPISIATEISPSPQCADSDGGKDFYIKGTTAKGSLNRTDYCGTGNNLFEHYCDADGNLQENFLFVCPNGCSNGACSSATIPCIDNDNGKDFYVKGTTSKGSLSYIDYCGAGSNLFEHYCDTNGDIQINFLYACPNGCSDGACLTAAATCTDSDGGINYDLKGTAIGISGGQQSSYADSCCLGDQCARNDGDTVLETYCEASYIRTTYSKCQNGCKDGACLSPTAICSDSDGGLVYGIKGTTSKGSLSYTDYCGVGNNLFENYCDASGNLQTNYLYVCPDVCKDGACVKSTNQSCKDSDGGLYYHIKGSTGINGEYTDYCPTNDVPNTLVEYTCTSKDSRVGVVSNYYICPNGCKEGTCLQTTETTPETPHGLQYYPAPFVRDNRFNGIIVVGSSAPAEDIVAAQNIIESLTFVSDDSVIRKIEIGVVKLDTEITNINQNIISIGNPCVNSITGKITQSRDCSYGLKPGEAVLKLFRNNGYTHLVVIGYSGQETKAIVKILTNYRDYKLYGSDYFYRPNVIACSETDLGIDYAKQGITSGVPEAGGTQTTWTDNCISRTMLAEYYCSNNLVKHITYTCTQSCKGGTCVEQSQDSDYCLALTSGHELNLGVLSGDGGKLTLEKCKNLVASMPSQIDKYVCSNEKGKDNVILRWKTNVISSYGLDCSVIPHKRIDLVPTVNCRDYDKGNNPNIKGFLIVNGKEIYGEDFCYDKNSGYYGYVGESYCTNDGSGTSTSNPVKCPNGCHDGACLAGATTPEQRYEQVGCSFKNSNSEQNCYSDNGKYGCRGKEFCAMKISGANGEKLTWKSSCGGYGYTQIDGDDETVIFDCGFPGCPSGCTCDNSGNIIVCQPTQTCPEGCSCDKDGKIFECAIGKAPCPKDCKCDTHGVVLYCGKQQCVDSDGGRNYYENGFTTTPLAGKTPDICASDGKEGEKAEYYKNLLHEAYCYDDSSNNYAYADYNCPNGCKDGACVPFVEEGDELDAGDEEYSSKGCPEKKCEGISKKCLGNHWAVIEECTHYIKSNDKCEGKKYSRIINTKQTCTAVEDDKIVTFCQGCQLDDTTCIPFGTRLAKKDSAYYCDITKKMVLQRENKASCQNSYECITNNCKSGICAPICEGCLNDDKACVPVGTRTSTHYCDSDYSFKNQNSEESKCNNNFECSSNLCVDNKCISPSLIRKVTEWFKKLFS